MAACAVVAYHYTAFERSHWGAPPSELFPHIAPISAYGALGVQLFFIVSGFVILMTAQGRTIGQFVTSRVARLYPAYWVAVLAAAFLFLVVAPGEFREVSPQTALVNLTMVQEAFGVPHLDGVYWTLWVELLFYVMIGFLIAIKPTEGKILAFAFLWPVVGALARTGDVGFLTTLLQPSYASLFAGGMVLYLIHRDGHNIVRWLLVAFNACLAAGVTTESYVLTAMQDNTGMVLSPVASILIVLSLFGVVALVTVTPLKYRGPRWLTYAGALTYPLYLFHETWGWFVIASFADRLNAWATLGIAVAVSLVLAVVVERWVERPARPALTRLLKRAFGEVERTSSGAGARPDRGPAPSAKHGLIRGSSGVAGADRPRVLSTGQRVRT